MKDTTPIFDPEGARALLVLNRTSDLSIKKAFLAPLLTRHDFSWRKKFTSLQPTVEACRAYNLAYFSIHSSNSFQYSAGYYDDVPLFLILPSGSIPVYPYPDLASLITWLPIKELSQKNSELLIQTPKLKHVRDWISYKDALDIGAYEEPKITGFDLLGV